MDQLVNKLRRDYPALAFAVGDSPCWSPSDNHVYYTPDTAHGAAGLLHELAHALKQHNTYTNDLDLLKKEVEAWDEACRLAINYSLTLDLDHIQDCLDTYRDWLHKRSLCPACHVNGLQTSIRRYSCLNCGHTWQVSNSRSCRPYRLSKTLKT
jgi:hypothetical protein